MLTVSSLSQFNFYKNFELHAGKNGLSRPISNVVIMEYESLLDDYSSFFEGDFVLTSLLFAVNHPERIYEAFEKLMKKGVSGIAIKNIFYKTLDYSVLELANTYNIPLFFFHDTYMENIILNVNKYQTTQQRHDYYEHQINHLLNNWSQIEELKPLLAKMSLDFQDYLAIMFIEPMNVSDKSYTQRTLNKILYQKEKNSDSSRYFCIKYQNGYLFLYHFHNKLPIAKVESHLLDLLNILSIPKNEMGISICSNLKKAEHLVLLIRQCLYTNYIRKAKQLSYLTFEELGIHQIFEPILMNSELRKGYEEKYNILKSYDEQHQGVLLKTLVTYIENQQQISITAKQLYQHPNTVRYRIKKIQELLQLESSLQLYLEGSIILELLLLHSQSEFNSDECLSD